MRRLAAAIQMCSSNIVADNFSLAAKLIDQAAKQQARLIALPEMWAIMGKTDQDKLAVAEDFATGPIQRFLREQAQQHKLWISGGTIPIKSEQPGKIKPMQIVFDDSGEIRAHACKMHLYDADIKGQRYRESDTNQAGNEITVVDTPIGRLGLAVCYDLRFPVFMNRLAQAGAEVIVAPSAFTVPTGQAHWQLLTRSTALQNQCYVIAPAQYGTHVSGRQTWGHSLIADPWGEIIALQHDDKDNCIIAEIDPAKLQDVRSKLPVLKHQRLGLEVDDHLNSPAL